MSLLLNGIRSYGGSPITLMGQHWQHFFADHMLAASMNSAGFGKTSSLPRGYYPPSAVAIAVTAGQMSTFRRVTGEGDLAGSMLAVKLAEADISGSGTLAALGGLIVQAVAAISGSGTISSADLKAFLAAVANISGSGTISSADLEGLGALLSALSGSGTAAGSTATGIGALDADITVTGTGLSTANVGQAVWSALAASNNEPDTMGEKLNDAGSAGNPWNTVIEGTYTAEEMLRLIAAALLGKATATGTTYTVRDLQDTLDRIVADVDSSGNRTEVDLDPT